MPDYRRSEAREWAKATMKGVCGCMMPTLNNGLTAVNERAIRHDIRLEKALGFWGALLVSECGTTKPEMRQVIDIGVDEARHAGLRTMLLASFPTLSDTIEMVRYAEGAGVDLGCGYGALATAALRSPAVTALRLVDLDRRAVDAARRNVADSRASFAWADARTLPETGDLDFVVTNPPFHDGGAEDRRLGQAFIRKAAGLLKKGGVLWLVANRHLPYEAELDAAFKRVRMVADAGGYKVFEAVK